MRILSTLFSFAILGGGLWWVDGHYPALKHIALEKLNSGKVASFEVKYTAKQIIDKNKSDLVKTSKHKCQSQELKFAPYLLMEVKYSKNATQTGEGVILWDLTDGEMILSAKTWEKTHGYGDCITAHASPFDFSILNGLAKKGGTSDESSLLKSTQLDQDLLGNALEACKRKKLIVQAGSRIRLHMENAKLATEPETDISLALVTTSNAGGERLSKRFSAAQIKKNATNAFGSDFAIKNATEIFLPFYAITIENPDGTLQTTFWNAVTGNPLATNLVLGK